MAKGAEAHRRDETVKPSSSTPGGKARAARQSGVLARCVGCGTVGLVLPGDVKVGEHPMCGRCLMPMIAERGIARRS